MTLDDIEDFFRKALEASITPEDTCDDPPAREFNLSVGLSSAPNLNRKSVKNIQVNDRLIQRR